MTLNIFSIEDKIAAIEAEISEVREFKLRPGSLMRRHYQILKAIASDLRARAELPRSNTLGALEREMDRLLSAPRNPRGFDDGRIRTMVNLVVSKWHTISQALELYGEESAE